MGYIPDRGDAIGLNFDPQAGHEQAGHRPALVLSPSSYNEAAGLALVCPITNTVRGYPFEVSVRDAEEVTGVILSDHVKSLDWRQRGAAHTETLPEAITREALAKVQSLLR
jgi:mRNA interferase MazF